MTLTDYTLLSVSVASTLISISLIALIVVGFSVIKRVYAVLDQLEAVSKTGLEATQALKEFVEKTTHKTEAFIQTFLTLNGAKEVVSQIAQTIVKARQKPRKESHEPTV